MTSVITLKPNDPLPQGHSVVLMQRFDEQDPGGLAIEMIVTNPDRSEETSRPTDEHGAPLGWAESVEVAKRRAQDEGLQRIWVVDRAAGARAKEILAHHGDHAVGAATLVDDDLDHGEHGTDMRDRGPDGAPRRF